MTTGIRRYVTNQSWFLELLSRQGRLNNMFAWASLFITESQALHYIYYDDFIEHWKIGMEYGDTVRVHQLHYFELNPAKGS